MCEKEIETNEKHVKQTKPLYALQFLMDEMNKARKKKPHTTHFNAIMKKLSLGPILPIKQNDYIEMRIITGKIKSI